MEVNRNRKRRIWLKFAHNPGKPRSRDGASLRSCVRGSFNSLWAAFTLTVHINALNNENVQRQEQHSSGIN